MVAFVGVIVIATAFVFAALIAYSAFFVSPLMWIFAAAIFFVAVGMVVTATRMYSEKDEPHSITQDDIHRYW